MENEKELFVVKLTDLIKLQSTYIQTLNCIIKRQQEEDHLEYKDIIEGAHKEIYEHPAILKILNKIAPENRDIQKDVLSSVITGSWDLKDRSFIPILTLLETKNIKVI